jgi:hypothetical protein
MLLHNDDPKLFEFTDEMAQSILARARHTLDGRKQLLLELREAGFDLPMRDYVPGLDCGVLLSFRGCRIFSTAFGISAYVDMGGHDINLVYSSVKEAAQSIPAIMAAMPQAEVSNAAPF